MGSYTNHNGQMHFPHLTKAPILEAVIDIQIKALPEELLDILKNAHDKIKVDYPKINTRKSRQFKIEMAKDPQQPVEQKELIEGYIFTSADGHNVLQFRRNGFTLSRVKNYNNFDSLLEETIKQWEIYKAIVGDITISRVATRYINQIQVPFPLVDNNEYLKDMPKPKTEPSESKLIRSFTDQIHSLDIKSNANVNMIRLMQEPTANATGTNVIIDIDVYRLVSDLKDYQSMWDIIRTFREVKNRLFYASIGKSIIEKYA
jgi:uncharacterized protein (TIGR04255 family)